MYWLDFNRNYSQTRLHVIRESSNLSTQMKKLGMLNDTWKTKHTLLSYQIAKTCSFHKFVMLIRRKQFEVGSFFVVLGQF